MNMRIKTFTASLLLLICASIYSLSIQAADDTSLNSLMDFQELTKTYGEPKVRINLEKGLLNLVASMAKQQNPEAAQLMQSLQAVTVNVYNIGENTEKAKASLLSASKKLEKMNWVPAVTVNEGDEQVRIFVKQDGDMIEGLMVMAVSKNDEAVFINIVGNIDPAQIGAVTSSLNLDLNIPQQK
jgi:hypothetical protein